MIFEDGADRLSRNVGNYQSVLRNIIEERRSEIYIVLYCIVLYCIVLYCIVLYCVVLCCVVLKSTDGALNVHIKNKIMQQAKKILKTLGMKNSTAVFLTKLWTESILHNRVVCFVCLLWRRDPTRAMASSFLRFLDHTQRRITVGRTPLDE